LLKNEIKEWLIRNRPIQKQNEAKRVKERKTGLVEEKVNAIINLIDKKVNFYTLCELYARMIQVRTKYASILLEFQDSSVKFDFPLTKEDKQKIKSHLREKLNTISITALYPIAFKNDVIRICDRLDYITGVKNNKNVDECRFLSNEEENEIFYHLKELYYNAYDIFLDNNSDGLLNAYPHFLELIKNPYMVGLEDSYGNKDFKSDSYSWFFREQDIDAMFGRRNASKAKKLVHTWWNKTKPKQLTIEKITKNVYQFAEFHYLLKPELKNFYYDQFMAEFKEMFDEIKDGEDCEINSYKIQRAERIYEFLVKLDYTKAI
jgi:hypothetical protein